MTFQPFQFFFFLGGGGGVIQYENRLLSLNRSYDIFLLL